MIKIKTSPRYLKELFHQGQNITEYLRHETGLNHNTREIIEISYDLQSGSYSAAMKDQKMSKFKEEYSKEIAKVIQLFCEPESIMEAGVGEATTLSGVIQNLPRKINSFGFDISLSRLFYAEQWLQSQSITDTVLCSGDLFNIPFMDNSIDVVYTSHSIEPNGGHEKQILKELHRVTKKYLILLEPGYDFASKEAKQRMDSHGYCKNLKSISEAASFKVLKHEPFPLSVNPVNPTAITIISKHDSRGISNKTNVLACPKYKTELLDTGETMFSPEALVVYPIIAGIPCLRIENGIFASHYQNFSRNKPFDKSKEN